MTIDRMGPPGYNGRLTTEASRSTAQAFEVYNTREKIAPFGQDFWENLGTFEDQMEDNQTVAYMVY